MKQAEARLLDSAKAGTRELPPLGPCFGFRAAGGQWFGNKSGSQLAVRWMGVGSGESSSPQVARF